MKKYKITITVDGALLKDVEACAERYGKNRSQMVEAAIRSWKRQELEHELIAGYRASAEEDRETAGAYLSLVREVVK